MPSKRPIPGDYPEEEEESPPQRRPAQQRQRDNGDDDGEYQSGVSDLLKPGFAAAKREMAASSPFANRFQAEGRSQIIKFLEPEPYVSYRRHWVKRTTQNGMTNRTYNCLRSINQPCALCSAGHRNQFVSCYNIAVVDNKGDVELKSWECGVRLATSLDDIAQDPKLSPLTRDYYLVSRSGEGTSTSYNVSRLKAADMIEDHDIPEPDEATLKALPLYTKDIVKFPTQKVMEELAEEIADEYG